MNRIKIEGYVEASTEIQVPYYGKSSMVYLCITGKDNHNNLRGIEISRVSLAIRSLIIESDFFESKPCTPAEFATAFEQAHHNLRAEFNAIIEAQEGGK